MYVCTCIYVYISLLFVVCSLYHSYPWHIAIVFSSPIVDILTGPWGLWLKSHARDKTSGPDTPVHIAPTW